MMGFASRMRLTRPTQRTLPPMSPMKCWRLRRRTRRYPPGRGSVVAKIVRVEQPTDWLSTIRFYF
jgi:hypothetical protein